LKIVKIFVGKRGRLKMSCKRVQRSKREIRLLRSKGIRMKLFQTIPFQILNQIWYLF